MKRRPHLLAAVAAVLASAGCYASNVVAEADRDVKEVQLELRWTPATAEDLPGFYASESVEGEAAGALVKAYYYFGADGDYSGAALVVSPEGPRFVVLEEEGHYTFLDASLDLDDGQGPVPVDAALGYLRLRSPETTIVFKRVELR